MELKMPRSGFNSVTIRSEVYDIWYEWYHDRRHNLYLMGITSFAGLITTVIMSVKNKEGEHLTKIIEISRDRK